MKTRFKTGMRISFPGYIGNDSKGLIGTVVDGEKCIIDWDNLGKDYRYGYKYVEDYAGTWFVLHSPKPIVLIGNKSKQVGV